MTIDQKRDETRIWVESQKWFKHPVEKRKQSEQGLQEYEKLTGNKYKAEIK